MCETQLSPPFTKDSADAALETFFKAMRLRDEGHHAGNFMRAFPIAPAAIVLEASLVRRWGHPRTKVQLYDQWINALPIWHGPSRVGPATALAWLWHPLRPDPWPMYHIVRKFAPPTPHEGLDQAVQREMYIQPGPQRTRWVATARSAAILLEERGFKSESQYLFDFVQCAIPAMALPQSWAEWAEMDKTRRALLRGDLDTRPTRDEPVERVPFPTFGFGT